MVMRYKIGNLSALSRDQCRDILPSQHADCHSGSRHLFCAKNGVNEFGCLASFSPCPLLWSLRRRRKSLHLLFPASPLSSCPISVSIADSHMRGGIDGEQAPLQTLHHPCSSGTPPLCWTRKPMRWCGQQSCRLASPLLLLPPIAAREQ